MSSDELVESSDESPKMLDWSEPVESDDVPLVRVDEATDAVVWVVAEEVPIGPCVAIAPNARTKVASDAATTRLRIRAIRAARARSFAWASCFGERVLSERGRSARIRSEGGGSDMERTVGAGCESTLGAAWEIPEPRGTHGERGLGDGPARPQRPHRDAADDLSWQGPPAPVPTEEGVLMKPKVRRLAVIVGASAALGAAGCGGTASTQTSTAASDTTTAAQRRSAETQGRSVPGGFDLTALAGKLGVSVSELRAAMEKTRPSGTPGQAPGASGTDPATALAKELGLSAAKVRAAMQALAPTGAPRGAPGTGTGAGAGAGGAAPQGAPGSVAGGAAPRGSGSSATTGSAA